MPSKIDGIMSLKTTISYVLAMLIFWGCQSEGGTLIDNRDGKEYRTVNIGKQLWMAENLNYGGGEFAEDSNSVVYGQQEENRDRYGRLYSWNAAQSACPQGWKVPSDEDWKQLEKTLGMEERELNEMDWRTSGNIGRLLRTSTGWAKAQPVGVDSLGFAAMPGGVRNEEGMFVLATEAAYFWTSTENMDHAIIRTLFADFEGIIRTNQNKNNFLSVRCIKK